MNKKTKSQLTRSLVKKSGIVIAAAALVTAAPVPVYAGTGALNTAESIHVTRRAKVKMSKVKLRLSSSSSCSWQGDAAAEYKIRLKLTGTGKYKFSSKKDKYKVKLTFISGKSDSVVIRKKSLKKNKLTLTLRVYDSAKLRIKIKLKGKWLRSKAITFTNTPAETDFGSDSVSMDKTSLLLARGSAKRLQVLKSPECDSNISLSSLQWASSNESVATVSSDGTVRAVGRGNAVISAQNDDVHVGCVVSVTTKSKIRAVKDACFMAQNWKYSQKKRMKDGYYDCSSLTWKALHTKICKFGSSSYAPTAADQYKYLRKKGRDLGKITDSKIQSLYYEPCDLAFKKNGGSASYKHIGHVEMIIGYNFEGFDSEGKPVVKLLGACYNPRVESYYYTARP